MIAFLRGVRYSLRSLSRSPASTAALLVTVAVGIGTQAALVGFVNGLLSRNLGLPDAGHIAAIHWRDGAGRYAPVPYESYLALRGTASSFESLAAFRESRANVTLGGRSGWMVVASATPAVWDVLRVPAALGRASFEEAHDGVSSMGVVISHKVWRDAFHGESAAIGAELFVDGRRGHVAAVAPDWFDGVYLGRAIDVWVPFKEADATAGFPGGLWLLARLRPEGRLDTAQRELADRGGPAHELVLMQYTGIEPEVQIKLSRVRSMLGWAGALVLLTAASNVAGFLLSRAGRRSHETAARVALGATRTHLAAQVVADSLVITIAGGLLGGVVAFWTAAAFPAVFYAEDAERLRLMPNAWQVAGSAGACSALMLLCALAPLMQINQHGPMAVLRRSEGISSTPVGWLRSALVIMQMGVCVVLMIAAALLFEGFREALRTVRAEGLGDPIVAVLDAQARYAQPAAGEDYFRRVERAAASVPGVSSVAWAGTLPGGRMAGLTVRLEQPPVAFRDVWIPAETPPGSRFAGFELKEGRPFSGRDGPFSCRVAIVNDAAASTYFDGHAVGRSIEDTAGRRLDIVGVVAPPGPGAGHARAGEAEPRLYLFERQALAAPPLGVRTERFRLPLAPASPPAVVTEIDMNVASGGYFDAIGASFESGGGFERAAPGGCDSVVVNREAAQLYFGGNAAGGAVIDPEGRRADIVGVVDAGVLRVMQRRAAPMVYFPMAQRYVPRMALIAGARHAEPALLAELTRRLREIPGGAQPASPITLEQHLARTSLGPERIATALVSASAGIALALGLLGAYGVMSDSVRQKKREIALRLALGAQGWTIVYHVLRDGVRIAAVGAAAGLVVSWILVRLLLHANPDFAAPAAWIWLACPAMLLTIVAVASVLPARWALAVDPLTVTRES